MKDRTTVLSIMRVTDIGRKSVIVFGALTLAIGRIMACFHWYGTVDVAMDMLNKCVSGLLDTLRYVVTLAFALLTLESCHVMPLGWSIRVLSLNIIRLTVPELERLQFSIDRASLKSQFLRFLG